MIKKLITALALLCILGCSKESVDVTADVVPEATMDFDLQWGGYYASKAADSEEYHVFRLLDFNREGYHIRMYKETFKELPTLDDVGQLSPFIGHAPMATRALLDEQDIHHLGGAVLTTADLAGYRYYLTESGFATDAEVDILFEELIETSNLPPVTFAVSLVDGAAVVTKK